MAQHVEVQNNQVVDIPKPNTGWIWKTFFVLVGITALEFVFVFFMNPGTLRNTIFIILTIFKAFFIVGEFMHLKHETKGLIWTIMIPTALLVWLLVALITEGSYDSEVIQHAFSS